MAWILIAAAALHLAGIGWGLPASDGWDNDGVAPRDFLAGLVETVDPGHFYTYPPVHLALLGLLTLPVVLVAVLRAPSFARADVVHEVLKVPYMTTIACIARFTSVLMSLGIVFAIGRIAEELRAAELGAREGDRENAGRVARRAGYVAAALVGVNMTFTYYAQTTNLDVPYLFWACLAVLGFVRGVTRKAPRFFRRASVFAVLAVATKDQAFALFVGLPIVLLAWLAFDPWAKQNRRAILRETMLAVAASAVLLLVLDGALINPTGFVARIHFLLGSASQDFTHYTNDPQGWMRVLSDVVVSFPRYYPWLFAPFVVFGVLLGPWRTRRAGIAVAWSIPLVVALSFTIAFNLTARRADHRFVLPQAIMLAVYGGLAIEPLVFSARKTLRVLSQAGFAIAFATAIVACAAVDATLLLDPRYDAEQWLATHVKPDETVEVYGLNVYMPRMPASAHVVRVGPTPAAARNPMFGATELQDAYGNARKRAPHYIVVNESWVWRHLIDPSTKLEPGREFPPTQLKNMTDPDATHFFQALVRGEGGYRLVHMSRFESKVWPRIDIHASTAREIWIYERAF